MAHHQADEAVGLSYDVAVIGGGAAGLSGALVLARARRRVLVIDSGAPRNAPATHMHGFLSRDGSSPAALLAAGRDEVVRYGAEIVTTAVDHVDGCETGGFRVHLANGATVSARRLLVATGLRDELPDVPGLRERWARDVLHCPYCHGWEVRDRRLGVLADGSPESLGYAQLVRQWSTELVALVPAETLHETQRRELAARRIDIVEGDVTRLVIADDRLVGVEISNQHVTAVDALFVPPRFVSNNDLLLGLGCAFDGAGWVVKDGTGATTVPGVWVAGNVANPRAQVITAAGEGSAAAIAINADLVGDDVQVALEGEHDA